MGAAASPMRNRVTRAMLCTSVVALSILVPHGVVAQGNSGDTPFVDTSGGPWSIDDPGFRSSYEYAKAKREAASRLARFPDSVNTVAWLAQAGRLGDALDVFQRVIERHPARIVDAVAALRSLTWMLQRDQDSEHQERLTVLIAAARATLPVMDRESAAQLEIQLRHLDSMRSFTRLTLPEVYRDTRAYRLAAIDDVDSRGTVSTQLGEYDAIVRREGTNEIAAKALYTKATTLVTGAGSLARETGDPDPTEYWLEVLDIVTALGSGRYPPGPWVDNAPSLISSFNVSRTQISPANAARLIEALRAFVVRHEPMLEDRDAPIAGIITHTMPSLAARLPDGVAVMERQFTELVRALRDPAAPLFLRALWLDQAPRGEQPMALRPRSSTHEADIRALMAAAAAVPRSRLAGRALARLAVREFRDPASLDSARAHFQEYLRHFGSAPDATVAALRLGRIEREQERYEAAARRFADVADANRGEPMVRALASVYAAHASEDAGRFDEALKHYRQADDAWTSDLSESLRVFLPSPPLAAPEVFRNERSADVTRLEVQTRLGELTRSLSARGGRDLERGRWLLRRSRPREAVAVLEIVAADQARTPVGAEARRVLTKARIDAALASSDAANPSANRPAALAELDVLAKQQPFDTSVGIAGILAATLSKIQGLDADADARMVAALRQWATTVARVQPEPKQGSLEFDVLAVRDALAAGWYDVSRQAASRPFVVATSSVSVEQASGGSRTTLDVSRQPAGATNVVFMTDEDIDYLTDAVSRMGGTRRRQPGQIMEVPNQPIGDAQAIIRWWNGFFAARPGHWSGFDIMTYPSFSVMRFTNEERTRAIVPVRTGYSGGDAVLSKVNDVWRVTGIVNDWIE